MQSDTQTHFLVKSCKSCGYVFSSDSSPTQYRCGIDYYHQPPLVRKQERMDAYPEVVSQHSCTSWKTKN